LEKDLLRGRVSGFHQPDDGVERHASIDSFEGDPEFAQVDGERRHGKYVVTRPLGVQDHRDLLGAAREIEGAVELPRRRYPLDH
jgi:hypothetical protein